MKKVASIVLVVFVLGVFLPNLLMADSKDDIQTIKKAVKKNPEYKAGQEAKWFKVLVTDNKTKKDKVKITLPISVIETLLKCVDLEDLKIDEDECDIDLKELFAELKELGPAVLIEVIEDDETIKIWFE
ncbi:MAG: hypothetical protein GTN73_05895 [Candidatus Aminicenantes bacterium]|nr:hypothetical protein [Candidatus Aminicenantes bacterium]